MGNINLSNLAKENNISNKTEFTYADVKVDFEWDQTQQAALFSNLKDVDLVGSYDLAAIQNSLVNFFTTFPGEKILNPNFGINLNQFLFMPCDLDTADLIGTTVRNQLTTQEPRINVEEVLVTANPENNEYVINLSLGIPFINNNTTFNFKALLNSTGIEFYN